ncbi:DUF7024 domain-containing protein [Ideonella sp. A 288]|uniref:DUF7024 domain-containing protein n=1 Tax=Ideonella sp. A 288 TaxID=1962181 RepID=UPI000B4BFD38|nr:hypothetical protein [Ideonella sp. A 288]
MRPLRLLTLAGVAALAAFYAHVGLLAARPQVSPMYRAFYIDQSLRHWNRGIGPIYRLGDTIDFGRAQPFLSRRGWSPHEDWGTWSDGPVAEIHLQLAATDRPRHLTLEVLPMLVPQKGLGAQTVTVHANGQPLGTRRVTSAQTLSFDIPEAAWAGTDGLLRLRLDLPDAASPRQLGLSRDPRQLGIGLRRLRVS